MRSDTLTYIYYQKKVEKMKHEAVLKLINKALGVSFEPRIPIHTIVPDQDKEMRKQ